MKNIIRISIILSIVFVNSCKNQKENTSMNKINSSQENLQFIPEQDSMLIAKQTAVNKSDDNTDLWGTINSYFEHSQHIWNFLTAIGTCAAVIISLWFARSSTKPKLNVYVDFAWRPSSSGTIKKVKMEDGKEINVSEHPLDTVLINVRNVGNRPAYISDSFFYFEWGFPYWVHIILILNKKIRGTKFQPMRTWQGGFENFPQDGLTVEPGKQAKLILKSDVENIRKVISQLCKDSGAQFYMCRFINLYIRTDDGHEFKARKGNEFKKMILRLSKS